MRKIVVPKDIKQGDVIEAAFDNHDRYLSITYKASADRDAIMEHVNDVTYKLIDRPVVLPGRQFAIVGNTDVALMLIGEDRWRGDIGSVYNDAEVIEWFREYDWEVKYTGHGRIIERS